MVKECATLQSRPRVKKKPVSTPHCVEVAQEKINNKKPIVVKEQKIKPLSREEANKLGWDRKKREEETLKYNLEEKMRKEKDTRRKWMPSNFSLVEFLNSKTY